MQFNRLFLKVAIIAAIIGILSIGIGLTVHLVEERQQRFEEAADEIGQSWGASQTVSGPYLRIPYVVPPNDPATKTVTVEDLIVLPTDLKLAMNAPVKERPRGIFKMRVYTLNSSTQASFVMPDLERLGIARTAVKWNKIKLEHCLTDARGINSQLYATWNGTPMELEPLGYSGIADGDAIGNMVTIDSTAAAGAPIAQVSYRFSLKGSRDLSFIPLGKSTSVTLESDWPHPSYFGQRLPDASTGSNPIRASWKMAHYGRSYPQVWTYTDKIAERVAASASGVKFIEPVGIYRQLERSIKYVFVIVLLTFALFFCLEMVNGIRIHPLQYLLVGFVLVIFYLLLIAFSEFMRFDISYLISTLAVVGLVCAYMRFVVRLWSRVAMIAASLAALYAFIYVLLAAESYSLIFGSVGLFVALALIMLFTRNVDWYAYGGTRKLAQE